MLEHQGIWLPDGERHLQEWMDRSGEIIDGRGSYQIRKLREALKWVRSWRAAVDCGSHVGFWSMHLVGRFGFVHAFEPMAEHRACFVRNVPLEAGQGRLYDIALGAAPALVSLTTPPGSSGGTHISGPGDIEVRTLDSFGLQDVDFLKIDVEGAELAVVEGARATLLRCKPCVIVEQKQHIMQANFGTTGTPAVDFLKKLGAVERVVLSGDHVLSWDP